MIKKLNFSKIKREHWAGRPASAAQNLRASSRDSAAQTRAAWPTPARALTSGSRGQRDEGGGETVDGELAAGGSSNEAKGTCTFASPLRT
jgi:hypothetical protein